MFTARFRKIGHFTRFFMQWIYSIIIEIIEIEHFNQKSTQHTFSITSSSFWVVHVLTGRDGGWSSKHIRCPSIALLKVRVRSFFYVRFAQNKVIVLCNCIIYCNNDGYFELQLQWLLHTGKQVMFNQEN